MSDSLFAFFHLCLVFVLFSGPSLLEMKFCRKLFPYILFFLGGFLNQLQIEDKHLLCWIWTLLEQEMNTFCASDERFSAGDKRVENARSNQPHIHTASYQQLSSRIYLEMVATHGYSIPKTGSSYHTLILTPEYITPTSFIRKAFPAGLNGLQYTKLMEKTINNLFLKNTVSS